MDHHIPTSRAEAFPFGLRVLVVDDDPTWLKILEKMLRKCSYEVTTCCLARVALDILRERKDKFDIVISDVNMPDMDGFKLLEHVGLEMDLPVIMMSVDGETSRVMKGVQHGACDYLLKPIRMKELQNIWQHVLRKKIHEVKEIENQDIIEEIQNIKNGSVDFEFRKSFNGADASSLRKRKDVDGKEQTDQNFHDMAAAKKARVIWSVDLHQKFVTAVNQIGFDKVGPKKILDLMNVPGLTRENVASHLQKYRLYLSRLQKQNEGKTFGGNVKSDVASKNSPTNIVYKNTIPVQPSTPAGRYVCTTQKILDQGTIPNMHRDDIKNPVSSQVTDCKGAVKADSLESQKLNSVSQLDVVLSFKGMLPNAGYKSIEPDVPKHQPWSRSTPVKHFMQYPKHDLERYSLLEDYSISPQLSKQSTEASTHLHPPTSVVSIACDTEKDKACFSEIKPVCLDYRSSHVKAISPTARSIDSVSIQVEHGKEFGEASIISPLPCIKDRYSEQASSYNLMPLSRESGLKDGQELASLPEDLSLRALQGIGYFENMGFNGMEIFQYNDLAPGTEFHSNWLDELELNCEYVYGSVMDECLFA